MRSYYSAQDIDSGPIRCWESISSNSSCLAFIFSCQKCSSNPSRCTALLVPPVRNGEPERRILGDACPFMVLEMKLRRNLNQTRSGCADYASEVRIVDFAIH